MNRIRIVADSSCDLITLDEVSFVSVPLTIRTETQEFRDDASLDVETMVDTLRSTKGRSYSACPSVADWERAFGEDDDVLAFTITSGLSGSFRAACAAKLNCEENSPSRRICIIDSLSTGPEIVLLIEKAVSELSAGADFDAVCRSVQDYQRRTHLIFALESLHNLAQNGRVGKLAAAAAGMLGIRAVGTTSDEGTLDLLGKCRRQKKNGRFSSGRNGTARVYRRLRPNRTLQKHRLHRRTSHSDSSPLSGCKYPDLYPSGTLQLLCGVRRCSCWI